MRRPRISAKGSVATTRSAFFTFATTARGAPSGSTPEGRLSPFRRPAQASRMSRSVESRGRARLRIRAPPPACVDKASLMRIPLHTELARPPAAVLFQRDMPGHASDPGAEVVDHPGRSRRQAEAQLRRARFDGAGEAQKETGYPRLTRPQHAAAGGRKIG